VFSEPASDAVLDVRHSRPGVCERSQCPESFLWCDRARPGRLAVQYRTAGPSAPVFRHPTCDDPGVSSPDTTRRPVVLAIFLIVAGVLGWWASFSLTVDKFILLENPGADLDCNFSLIVQCGENLSSWQGAVFGFPNPVLGLGGFVAPIAVGVSLLAGARFARWFWIAFNVGLAGALSLVIWLISQSIFVLHTLCPWCMLVWSVTIPLFWIVTARNLAEGVYGSAATGFGRFLRSWQIPLVILSYAVVVFLAQLELDILSRLAVGTL